MIIEVTSERYDFQLIEHQPLTPLETTIAKAYHSQSPKDSQRRKTLHIKHPERVTEESQCNPFDEPDDSSDSWTGDELFLERPSKLRRSRFCIPPPASEQASNPPQFERVKMCSSGKAVDKQIQRWREQ